MRLIGHQKSRRRSPGQALVEFALVIPLFITLFVAICEFTFMFSAYVSMSFASHDGAQLAATLGATGGADAAVVNRINTDVMSPADPKRIVKIDIFWVDTTSTDGSPVGGWAGNNINTWTYDGGSHVYTLAGGGSVTLPFAETTNGYPEANRCNVNLGTGCASGHHTVDTIGVRITYQHVWVTPFPNFVGGGSTGPLIQQTTIMRLEPIQ
jgi:hypothetical protein